MIRRTVKTSLLCAGLILLLLAGAGEAKHLPKCKKGEEPCGSSCMPLGAQCCTQDGLYCVVGERCVGDACETCVDAECKLGGSVGRAEATGSDNGAEGRIECPADMVAVPGGDFFMGCNEAVDTECYPAEKPGKPVEVPGFCIDRMEVTVAAYVACVRATACRQPRREGECNWGRPGREMHPVNCVEWQDAATYCEWAGKRLPNEAEWEKAARGTDGRVYPWGNLFVGDRANTSQTGVAHTQPVGSYSAGRSPYGVFDMAGNVWEWVADKVDDGRAVRGGSWTDGPKLSRTSYRDRFTPASRFPNLGFRCAR